MLILTQALERGKEQRLSRKGVGREPEKPGTRQGQDIVHPPVKIGTRCDQWRHAAVEYTKKAHRQSFKDWFNKLPAAMGKALAEDIESKILDLPSGLSSVGTTDNDVGEDEILGAIQGLLQNSLDVLARPGEFTFAFDAGQFKALKKLKALSDAGYRGQGAGGFAQAGRLPDILGVPAYLTNQVEASGSGKNNLLFHREWAAWAIQRNMDISMKEPSDRLSTVAIVDYLAGFTQVRSDHAYSILSK